MAAVAAEEVAAAVPAPAEDSRRRQLLVPLQLLVPQARWLGPALRPARLPARVALVSRKLPQAELDQVAPLEDNGRGPAGQARMSRAPVPARAS